MLLDMAWVPREQNCEADAITNGDVAWLNPEKEIKVDLQRVPFTLLHELLEKGKDFYAGIELVSACELRARPKTRVPLRVRDHLNGEV